MSKKKNKKTIPRAEALKRKQRKKLMMRLFYAAAIVAVAILIVSALPRGGGGAGGGRRERGDIDIDFTAMSDTMVYAALLNVMRNANNHVGDTIRISGFHQVIARGGTRSHYVVVVDQTGCCPQRMEFRRQGNYVFPDDYPPEFEIIELTGVFTRGSQGFYLSVNDMQIVE